MYSIMKKDGYPYIFDTSACSSCGGRCCTGESGNIFVRSEEINSLVSLLKIDKDLFREKYLEKRGYKFSLKERRYEESYDCIFYDREINGCTVYEARPEQCRSFPFWDYYKTRVEELKLECPGIIDA